VKAKPFSKQKIGLLLSSLLSLAACGGQGGGGGEDGLSPTASTLSGSIKSITGSQSEMYQWVLAMVQRDTGISHAAVINAVGNYSIEGVDLNEPHTLVLLDPQYRFSAVLSYAGKETGTVRQYFRSSKLRLPTLVHNGPVINFTDVTDIAWETDKALDEDNDLIPNGRESRALFAAKVDTDSDGIANDVDSDIDGDGVANWFDADDDGDGTLDAFDADANGDEVADLGQTLGDLYFFKKIQYLSVQVMQDVQDDESLATTVTFTTRVLDTDKPSAMKVRGPEAMLAESQSVRFDLSTGELQRSPWDLTLVDDGTSEDGAADDLTYARRVQLRNGSVPRANQVLFLQHVTTQGSTVSISEFPFTFPNMVTGVIRGTYDQATRKVTISGQPFGSVATYRWSVHVFDASSIKVFASEPIDGTTPTYTLPEGVIDAGKSYTARLVATAIDRIPSFPSWVIRSASFAL
jgi:hypothetical protein